jgi:hypothetical protein
MIGPTLSAAREADDTGDGYDQAAHKETAMSILLPFARSQPLN